MEELYSMFVNKNLINANTSSYWASTSVVSDGLMRKFFVRFSNGEVDDLDLSSTALIWCVKR